VATGLEIAMIDEGNTEYYSLRHPAVWIYIRDLAFQFPKAKPAGEGVSEFEIAGGWQHMKNQPIHENMSLAALILADRWAGKINRLTDASVTWDTAVDGWQNPNFDLPTKRWSVDQFEYIRGVVWNDDPACALFNDSKDRNSDYAIGVDWLLTFKKKEWVRYITAALQFANPGGATRAIMEAERNKAENQIINRSHYGNLQFLHSMACEEGEEPAETKRKIMIWLEVMYKLACRDKDWGIRPETSIKDTKLQEFFSNDSIPNLSDNLRRLLLAKTPS
jgi:hypothetical protein